MLLGVPLNRVLRRIRETREQRYDLFRGFFRGVTDEIGDERDRLQPRLHSVVLPPGRPPSASTLGELDLRAVGVEVTATAPPQHPQFRRRIRKRGSRRATSWCCAARKSLAAAEIRLMQG